MKRIIFMIIRFFLKIVIYLYYGVLSIRDDIKTKKYAEVKIKNDFTGGKVMLLALYEKSSLRNDTLELIKEAKRNNVFVVAVNTLRLEEHNYPLDLVDVYIERDNYGRDFGSYKAGMKYFFDKGFQDKCERLLIINDSVFFSKRGLPEFVHNLFNTDVEVLGATENSQHSHHLGSFCISVAGKIVRNVKFKNFWFNYKASNVRPLVIKRGEFGLSRLLKSLVSSEQSFKSLFNISFMERKLSNDKALYESYYYYRREGESSWRNRSITGLIAGDEVLSSYYNKYILANKRAKSLAFASNDLSKYHATEHEYSKLESSKVDYLEAVNFLKVMLIKKGS
jgi:Lipopolysaccharide biosynthesis protein